jgi:pSer/pThr/pTyr-binding forkhead associated (FHA) protein
MADVATACLVCQQLREVTGVACAECLDELKPRIAITPEQVRMVGGQPTTAVLVEPWGRAHGLRKRTVIGRVLEGDGLRILDATISRRHAEIELRDGAWWLEDFGSANGTFIEERRIEAEHETRLRDAERIRFGEIRFFFLDGIGTPLDLDTASLRGFTVRGPLAEAKPLLIELREPSGGGGGVAVIEGKPIQLTLPQFELVELLYRRAQQDAGSFMPAGELARTLSLDSSEPGEDHVRQLVRRLRRVLFKAGISNLIESRYGSGYRLVLLRA